MARLKSNSHMAPKPVESIKTIESTSDIPEGDNLYFTPERVLGVVIDKIKPDYTKPALGDTVLMTIQKLMGMVEQISGDLLEDHSSNGLKVNKEYGEDISFGKVLKVNEDGKVIPYNGKGYLIYLAVEDGKKGDIKQVLKLGTVRDDSWSWVPDTIVYANELGDITYDVDSNTNKKIGIAISSTKIEFSPVLGD